MGQNGITTEFCALPGKRPFLRIFFAAALTLPMFLSAFCSSAPADEFHYSNTLIGDRASGLGGAYTAISDDAAGLYYNPAGIIRSSGRSLSVSVNVFYNTQKRYKEAIVNFDWERKSAALLPNYFGVIRPLGRVMIGFSYAVPDSGREDQDQIFIDVSPETKRDVINFHTDDNTYNLGPSVAVALRDDLSAGLTLYYFQRRLQFAFNELVIYDTPTYGWTNRFYQLTESGLRPLVGLMWYPVDSLSLGFSLSKVFLFESTEVIHDTCSDTNIDGLGCDVPLIQSDETNNVKRKFPLQAVVGATYYPSADFLISGDLKYFSSVKDAVRGDRVAVLNLALGVEYTLSNIWTVRGGLFTDLANTPDLVSDRTQQLEHVDLYGISTGVRYALKTTSLTMGGVLPAGPKGADRRRKRRDTAVGHHCWTIFLSSSYSY
jgi:long-chain fatty acid transport protein